MIVDSGNGKRTVVSLEIFSMKAFRCTQTAVFNTITACTPVVVLIPHKPRAYLDRFTITLFIVLGPKKEQC